MSIIIVLALLQNLLGNHFIILNCAFAETTHPHLEQCNEIVPLSELILYNNSSKTSGFECSTVQWVTASHTFKIINEVTSACRVEPPDHEGKLNYISKYVPYTICSCEESP